MDETSWFRMLLRFVTVSTLVYGQQQQQQQDYFYQYRSPQYDQPKHYDSGAAAAPAAPKQASSYAYSDYGNGNAVGNNYEDIGDDYGSPPAITYQCYECMYRMHLNGRTEGKEGCRDPFNSNGVQVLPCDGACGKVYVTFYRYDYMIHRSCLPKCEFSKTNTSYTECCTGDRCNATVRPLQTRTAFLLCLLLSLSFLLQRLLSLT